MLPPPGREPGAVTDALPEVTAVWIGGASVMVAEGCIEVG
jgi:hypothetical protein